MSKIGLIALLLVLTAFIIFLFLERFEKGDVFPKYSVLRTDAYGNSILYETLKDLLPNKVHVKEESFLKFNNTKGAFFYFSSIENMSSVLKANQFKGTGTDSFFSRGNTLVLAFANSNDQPFQYFSSEHGSSELPSNDSQWTDQSYRDLNIVMATEELLEENQLDENICTLPIKLKHGWSHFSDDFTPLIKDNRGHVIALKRNVQKGHVILISSSFLLSNQFLFENKEAKVIDVLFLEDKSEQIIFDQTHLGIVVIPSTMGLIIRYKLDKLLFLLLVSFVLYVWRINVNFNKYENINEDVYSEGVELNSLSILLENNLTPNKAVEQGLLEWKKSTRNEKKEIDPQTQKAIKEIQSNHPKGSRNTVSFYNQITELLSIRKNK